MGTLFIITGLCLTLVGIVVKSIEAFGVPRLPGDIFLQKGGVTFFFPLMTCIVVSIVLTVVLRLFRR